MYSSGPALPSVTPCPALSLHQRYGLQGSLENMYTHFGRKGVGTLRVALGKWNDEH